MRVDQQEPTLRDVAKLARVHVGTASRALSGDRRDLVAPETVARVSEAADKLGYRGNAFARALATRRSHTVGLLIADVVNPIFATIARGVEDVLFDRGYTSLVANTDNEPTREAAVVDALRERHVDGLIVGTARRKEPLLRGMQRSGVPIVLVLRGMDTPGMWGVLADERGAMHEAVTHLLALGHTEIAHVAGPQNVWSGHERYVGFLDALTTLGADGHEALVTFGNRFAFSEGAAACRELLAKGVGFSAIVAGNDLMALGCIQTLAQAGLRCPDDVSVIGVNDMPFADLVTPPLTTVRLSGYEMGAAAAAMLLERLENPGARARRELLPTELIVRESTGPPSSRRTRHPRRRS